MFSRPKKNNANCFRATRVFIPEPEPPELEPELDEEWLVHADDEPQEQSAPVIKPKRIKKRLPGVKLLRSLHGGCGNFQNPL